MACPTCSHTMQCVTAPSFGVIGVFWCPRCGTIKRQTDTPNGDTAEVPKLVERCREFYPHWVMLSDPAANAWRRLGIAESINTPEGRP